MSTNPASIRSHQEMKAKLPSMPINSGGLFIVNTIPPKMKAMTPSAMSAIPRFGIAIPISQLLTLSFDGSAVARP
jgi:hypothetical protein